MIIDFNSSLQRLLLSIIESKSYYATKQANVVKDLRPDPPTPINITCPINKSVIINFYIFIIVFYFILKQKFSFIKEFLNFNIMYV